MTKIILTVTTFLVSLIAFAQVSENRTVANFSKLDVSNAIEVFYTVSDTRSIKIETDEKEKLECIKTEIEDGVLKLYVDAKKYKKENGRKRSKGKGVRWVNGLEFTLLRITVFGPNLNSIKVSTSSNIKFQNTNKSSNLEIKTNASGSITGMFECDNAQIAISSSGLIKASIKTRTISIDASSSGLLVLKGLAKKGIIKSNSSASCELKDFEIQEATIEATSSSSVKVSVTSSLVAKTTSSGSIHYYGNPSVTKEENSSGSIIQKAN